VTFRAATDTDRDAWQALVGAQASGDFLHDWTWDAVAAFDGQPQRRFLVEEGGEPVALASAQVRRMGLGRSFWYVPHGPVTDYVHPAAAGRLRREGFVPAVVYGLGNDTVAYSSVLDGHDLIGKFDGDAAGGQDMVNLDLLFASLGVPVGDRAARVSIIDKGATVDVRVDTDGNIANGFELTVATLQTTDVITVGEDVFVGL